MTIDVKAMTETVQRLLSKKDSIKNEVLKIQAKKEASEKALEDFKKRCLEKNVNPEKLEEIIQGLYLKYVDSIKLLEENIFTAEEYLKNFTEKV